MQGKDNPTRALLISGATVIDGVSDLPIKRQSILIEGQRIKAIGKREELDVPPHAVVIDADGKYVIPGLMNANVHLIIARLESLVRYEGQYEDLILEAAQVALKNGLTTVFDTWGPRKPLMLVRDRINAGELLGSRVFCGGNIIGLDGPFSLDFGGGKGLGVLSRGLMRRINALYVENVGPELTWMTPEDVALELRAYIGRGVDLIKYSSSEHRWMENEATASILFSAEAQAAMVNEAHAAGITAQAHTSAVEGLRVAVEAGCDLIQHCNITGPVRIPGKTIDLMVQKKTGAVVFPLTKRRFDWVMQTNPPEARRFFSTVNDNCRHLIQAGAKLMLGSDGNILPPDVREDPATQRFWMAPGEDNLADLGQGHFAWLKAMEEMGLPAMEGLRAATLNIAVAYGKDEDLGSLEPGKLGDLLILDKDPLRASENYRSIKMIIKGGAVVDHDSLPVNPILTQPAVAPDEIVASYGRFALSNFPFCC